MDDRIKRELLRFIDDQRGKVGDLGWIRSPQRRFHRHEFFDSDVGLLELPTGERLRLRDLSYGGVGLARSTAEAAEGLFKRLAVGVQVDATLRLIGCTHPVRVDVRHERSNLTGCEFVDPDDSLRTFLSSFIQFMDAGMFVRQAPPESVFPEFRGPAWLNLSAHEGAIRLDIRRSEDLTASTLELSLVYSFEEALRLCSYRGGKVDICALKGPDLARHEWLGAARQATSILVGIRQGAAMPDFGPVVRELVLAADGAT